MPEQIKFFPAHSENPHPVLSKAIILSFALIVTTAVYQYAWITEDTFITLRYVSNTLAGYGAVFNVGDHVQGYSHPLWFILLLFGSAVFSDPILVAIGYGLIITFVTALLVGWFVFRLTPSISAASGLLLLYSLFCAMSKSWLSFQTSGLENSLSHLLIITILIECYFSGVSRPGKLTLLLSLLCLNRPDFIFFAAPIGLLVLWNIRSWRQIGAVILGSLPALGWLIFAWAYYGDIIPNTAYAKVGIYATVGIALQQGWYYLTDWIKYDTLAAGGTLLFLVLLFTKRHSTPLYACLSGIVLYLLWIIWVGGGFMRGRLFMPVFVASIFLGLLWIEGQKRSTRRWGLYSQATVVIVLTLFLTNQMLTPDPGAMISERGIVDERAYYPGYHLQTYLQHGLVNSPYLNLGFADDLRAFANICGPVTFHDRNPGTWGYLTGAQVTIIDTLGLTDSYIAKLPREFIIGPHPRPGHADKMVPQGYYEKCGAISVYPEWRTAISKLNCDFPEE